MSVPALRTTFAAFLDEVGGLRMAFQPIADLVTGRPVAFEALARFGAGGSPASVFEVARAAGFGEALEMAAIGAALERAHERPADTRLSVNLSPSMLLSPRVLASLPADLTGVIIEVTENELVDGDHLLVPRLAQLRDAGARIAVDDAGAGYASLKQVMHLRPDIIKIDRSLVTGVDRDPAKQALVDAFVSFARRIGAVACAEGIESMDELAVLADLDVATGQGYVFARPDFGWPAVDGHAAQFCGDRLRSALRETTGAGGQDSEATYEAVARRLAACRTLADLDLCLDSMHRLLDVPELSVSRLVDDGGEPALVACAGPRWGTEPPYRLADYPATARALVTGEALQVLISDPEADRTEVGVLVGHGYGALLLIPLIAQDEPVGTLEAFMRAERPWTRRQIMLARAVAHQLAMVVGQLASPADPLPRGVQQFAS